jgi:hypothetical protein
MRNTEPAGTGIQPETAPGSKPLLPQQGSLPSPPGIQEEVLNKTAYTALLNSFFSYL